MKTYCLLCVLAVLCVWVQQGSCATGADAKNLRTKLFVTDGYDKKVRPTNNQSLSIEVYMNFQLLTINELSESAETLKVTGYLEITWIDEFLQWNPDDYGGLSYYLWPQGDVWTPDVTLRNSYLDYKELGLSSLHLNIHHSGAVTWSPFQVFQSTCSMNILYYPFDVQRCKLIFIAWSYSKEEVTMHSGDNGIQLLEYKSNSAWDVVDTSYKVEWETGEAAVVFTIKLKRKPLYVLLTVIMPIIMLAVLNILVFVLPCASGEKASFSITVFLSFAVFMSIISSTLPINSEVVAMFWVYLIIQTLQSTTISLLALVMIRCTYFDKDVTPVPRWIQTILRIAGCRPCLERSRKNRVIDSIIELQINKNKKDESMSIVKKGSHEIPEESANNKYSWKQATDMFDKIFLVFFSLVLVLSTTIFFTITAFA